MKKYTTILEHSAEFNKANKISDKLKHLILDLYNDELLIGKLTVNAYFDNTTVEPYYNVSATIYLILTHNNYNSFKQFIDIFNNNGVYFNFHNTSFYAKIYNNITNIINDLELIKNTKNYNL
jgi:hypothetical protein